MLRLEIDAERIEIKFEAETKFKMAAIADFVGWRHVSWFNRLQLEYLALLAVLLLL